MEFIKTATCGSSPVAVTIKTQRPKLSQVVDRHFSSNLAKLGQFRVKFGGSENDLINCFLFKTIPLNRRIGFVEFFQYLDTFITCLLC
jgi:hypothetical protein